MKKKLITLFSILTGICAMIGLTACHSPSPTPENSSSQAQEIISSSLEENSISTHTHVFNQEYVNDNFLKKPATCTSLAEYYLSCLCGEKGTETFTYGETVSHNYSELKYNAEKHWYECICGDKDVETTHNGGKATCEEQAICTT